MEFEATYFLPKIVLIVGVADKQLVIVPNSNEDSSHNIDKYVLQFVVVEKVMTTVIPNS